MYKIGERLNIQLPLNAKLTRYSFSTILKCAGASTEFIQEALGHTDKKTTEAYLGSFSNELKKGFAQVLTEFKQPAGVA